MVPYYIIKLISDNLLSNIINADVILEWSLIKLISDYLLSNIINGLYFIFLTNFRGEGKNLSKKGSLLGRFEETKFHSEIN